MDRPRNIKLPSGLYGFHKDDLAQFRYRDFLITNVFENLSVEQEKSCVQFWLEHGAISSRQAAQERAQQVCYYITHVETEELVGVNTLYIDKLKPDGHQFWFNRMFLNPLHRDTRLMITSTAMTLAYGKLHLAERTPIGIINVNENRKLSRPGMQKIFRRLGYQRLGFQRGDEVILFNFSNVEFVD